MSFGARCDAEVVLSVLEKAVSDGHWLVLNNCHLLEQWDHKLVARLTQLMSSFRGRWTNNNYFKLHLFILHSSTNAHSQVFPFVFLPADLSHRGTLPDSPVLPTVVYNSRMCIMLHTR